MDVLDLFSAAAGGWSLGLHRAGFRTVAACESIEWRRALYCANNPGVVIYDDVQTLTADRIVSDLGFLPGIVVGSPPCQDISSANTKGKGVEGERSGLYFEAIRIIGEVRPRWFALENSANLRTRGADAVLSALEGLGYTCWAFVVRASDIGANHERPRSWIIGCDVEQVVYAPQDGSGQGISRGRAEPVERLSVETCGDAPHANNQGEHAPSLNGEMAKLRRIGGDSQPAALDATRVGHESGRTRRHGPDGDGSAPVAASAGNSSDAIGYRPKG